MEANYVHKDSTTLVQDELVKNELNQIELQYNALKQQKFNELLKENQELKKQLEDKTEDYRRMKDNFDSKVDVLTKIETQQKEFINWLEDEIQQQETVIAENQEKSYFLIYEDEKEDLKLSSQKAYIRRIILEEVLQKYKEIIGVSDENNIK